MVYYRSFIQYYLINGLARGVLRGEFWKIGGIHQINQAATDGALARFFSLPDFQKLSSPLFVIEQAWITGQKPDAVPLPNSAIKRFLLARLPDSLTRFLTDRLRLGTFLIVKMRKV
jgi:hypothetical protein